MPIAQFLIPHVYEHQDEYRSLHIPSPLKAVKVDVLVLVLQVAGDRPPVALKDGEGLVIHISH
jgi:hypothetical protein